ncbi:growth hormone secretagogue receptor type 1 [Nematostella vectensis]|uniref:growth hormone secretagogue receptor type 1 n=1 Tax=Nematostella vectensis TaxID=45351 RepID=UPI002076EEEF|nr:growth hormone secretagogue receptor type 1 [Nematostella vectensis]
MELSNVSSSTNTSAPAQIASSLPLSMVMVLELACITVILGNLLVILAFCSYRQRTAPDILILSLSLADFLDSGIALQMVVFIKYLLRFPWTQRSCDSFIVLLYTFRTASASTVTFMAAERALLLVYPIRHRTMVTIPRTSKLILAIWVFSLVCGGLSFIGVGHSSFHKHEKACPYQLYDIGIEYAILFEVLGGLMLLVTLLSFIAIKVSGRKFLRRQSMMKMPLRKVSKQALCEEYSSRSRGRGGSRAHETAGMTSVRRLTLMMAIVVVVFFVSWMPFLLNNLASLITKRPPRTTISLAASMASFLHAVVNPLLYGKMSKRYRRGYIYVMKQIVAFFCGRKSSHVPSVYFSNTAHVTSQTAADNTGYIVGTDSNGNTGDIITSLSNRRYSSEGTEQISTGVINNYDTKHTSKDDIARISCDSPTALVDGACILDGIIPAATRDIDLRSHVSISIL